MTKEIRLAQLLCSRLCHDLVGPAGAVNAGLELADEGGLDEATLGLMAMSAGEMTNRLGFYRVAFGAAAGNLAHDGLVKIAETRTLAESLIDGGKISLEWPNIDQAPDALPAGQAKVLLLLVLLASEGLPRGGRMVIQSANLDEGFGIAVAASGAGAKLRDDVIAALNSEGADGLTPRNVHGYFTQLLAQQLHGQLDAVQEADDELRLVVLFSDA